MIAKSIRDLLEIEEPDWTRSISLPPRSTLGKSIVKHISFNLFNNSFLYLCVSSTVKVLLYCQISKSFLITPKSREQNILSLPL